MFQAVDKNSETETSGKTAIDADCEIVIYIEPNGVGSFEVMVDPPEQSKSFCVNSAGTSNSEISSSAERTCISIESYIPDYSKPIKKLLHDGDIYKEWDRFVEETAYHVLSVGNFTSRGIYHEFGRLMYSRYPCIGHPAMKDPWVSNAKTPFPSFKKKRKMHLGTCEKIFILPAELVYK